jgi:hypothetical protein
VGSGHGAAAAAEAEGCVSARRAWREDQAKEFVEAVRKRREEATMAKENGSALERLCGLFTNQTKGGEKYLGGKIDETVTIPAGSRIMIFKAKERRSDRSPTHSLLVAPPDAKQGAAPKPRAARTGPMPSNADSEEIPF